MTVKEWYDKGVGRWDGLKGKNREKNSTLLGT